MINQKKINFENYSSNKIDDFIKDNIELINEEIKFFSGKNIKDVFGDENYKKVEITSTEILVRLAEKFSIYVNKDENSKFLLETIKSLPQGSKEQLKKEIIKFSNKNIFYKKDVENYYKKHIFDSISNKFISKNKSKKVYTKKIADKIFQDFSISNNEKTIVYKDILELINSYLLLSFNNGFSQNVYFNEPGLKNANEGDSAQFLFVSRAILAGFNCSNVDLRSSKYDAVIDYDGVILRVQVKGRKNESDSIALNGRPRGGEGNDTHSSKNKAQFIRQKDCDVYVNIVKKTGICYIIPTFETEKYVKNAIKVGKKNANFPKEEAEKYRENWEILFEVANKIKTEKKN